MPAKSIVQLRLMQAVAHNPEFAKKAGIPQSVGREFSDAGMAQGMGPEMMSESKKTKVKKIADALKRGH